MVYYAQDMKRKKFDRGDKIPPINQDNIEVGGIGAAAPMILCFTDVEENATARKTAEDLRGTTYSEKRYIARQAEMMETASGADYWICRKCLQTNVPNIVECSAPYCGSFNPDTATQMKREKFLETMKQHFCV